MTLRALRGAPVILLAAALGCPAATAQAADAEPPFGELNAALVANHVLPRYARLEEAAAAVDAAAGRACAAPDPQAAEAVKAAYHGAMDGWMGVQHIRFGPIELFMRAFRLYFWPESRGDVAAAVGDLLRARDRDVLAPERFREVSVAAQGLPAVEVLLYDPAMSPFAGDGANDRCDLLQAVTANLRDIAKGVVADWQGGSVAFSRTVAEPGPDNPYYRTAREATLALFTSLHSELELIADVKLRPVVGQTAATARPHLAESRLSGRALRNIVVNLEALEAMYLGEGGMGFTDLVRMQKEDPELDPLMRKAFRLTLATARGTDAPLQAAVADPAARPKVEKLLTQVRALKQIVRTRLAAALGLTLGFNALDGD